MEKVIVTGGSGFLGQYLKIAYKKLFKKKYKCFFLSFSKKSPYSCDLSKKHEFLKILKEVKPDYIINLASETNLEKCEKEKRKAYRSIVMIAKNLTHFSKIYKYKIIHISTDKHYGFRNKKKNKENSVKPINYYSKLKLNSEKIIKNNKNFLILRTNFFGSRFNKGLVNWLRESAKKKKKIYFFKNIYFGPLYALYLSKIIFKIINSKNCGIYNLGSSDSMSKANFLIKINNKLKLKNKFNIIDYSNKNQTLKKPLNMRMNIDKFEKDFKFKLPSISNQIKEMFNEEF